MNDQENALNKSKLTSGSSFVCKVILANFVEKKNASYKYVSSCHALLGRTMVLMTTS